MNNTGLWLKVFLIMIVHVVGYSIDLFGFKVMIVQCIILIYQA